MSKRDQEYADAAIAPKRRNGERRSPAAATDRLPPHSMEAEQGVLGCLLLSAEEGLNTCEELGVRVEWFYDLRHQLIFHNFARLAESAPAGIDLITLTQRLNDSGELERVGGEAYLGSLADKVPSAANLSYYADILREKWISRQVVALYADGIGRFYENGTPVDSMLADAQEKITRLAEHSVPRLAQSIRELLPAVQDDIEDYHRGHAQIRGLPTGIECVDKYLCGIGGKNSKMVIIAGRPSLGKTSLVLDWATHMALDASWFEPLYDPDGRRRRDETHKMMSQRHSKAVVGIFSFEMTAESLVDRMLWQRARADKQRWRTGLFEAEDLKNIQKVSPEVAASKIHIDDIPCPVEELCARARQMKRQFGIQVFMVDYIQLLYSRRDYKGDRVQELAYISRLLTMTAKLLNTPFIVAAQMNRDYEKDVSRKPRLSDLKDCGAIEQDADVVGFLYEPKLREKQEKDWQDQLLAVYPNKAGNDVDWSRAPSRVNLLIAKYRNGPTGDCPLLFHKSCMHFEDYWVWQKANKLKEPAASEESRYKGKEKQTDMEDLGEHQ